MKTTTLLQVRRAIDGAVSGNQLKRSICLVECNTCAFPSAAAEAKALGLHRGGDWMTFKDWAHVQLYPNTRLKQIRKERSQ